MELWHTEERYQGIGDVIVKFSPFFKMYTEYVKNFDNAIHTINTIYAKNSKFSTIMDIIHVSFLKFEIHFELISLNLALHKLHSGI